MIATGAIIHLKKSFQHTSRIMATESAREAWQSRSRTADFLEFVDSPEEILETLGGLFTRPSKLIDSLMDPIKKHKKVPFDDWPALLAYLSKVRSMLKEVDRLGDKLPSDMVRKWMDYSNELLDSQLGATCERFVTQDGGTQPVWYLRQRPRRAPSEPWGSPVVAAAAVEGIISKMTAAVLGVATETAGVMTMAT
jgi:hypothetical protein